VVAEIERTTLALTERGGLSVLLVEQHVGFALNAAGGASTDVRAAMAT
jgi:urea transport system ATP-binding protein